MYSNGFVVTLIARKTHGEGEDAMVLAAGVCGMVVQVKKKAVDDNHEYVVDFGPYGQWYCYHNELQGQVAVQEEGYDNDGESLNDIARLLRSNTNPVDPVRDDEKLPSPIDFEADLKKRMKEIESGTY